MVLQILDKYRSVIGYINYVLCLLMLFFASAPDFILRLFFNIWLISWALEFRWLDKNNFSFRKHNRSVLLLVAFVLIESISLLWSENQNYGFSILSKHLYFVAIALVCFFGVNERYNLKVMLYVFISGAIIVGCCYFVVVYYVMNRDAVYDYLHNIEFVMPPARDMAELIHCNKLHQNLGLSLTLAIVAIPFLRRQLIKDVGRLNAYVLMSCAAIIISLCIYFSGCRSSLLVLFTCLFVGVMFRMRTKGRLWAIGIVAVLSIVFFSMMKHHPRSQNVSFELSKCITGKFEGNEEPRILIWHGVYKIAGEHLFFGSGLGSSRDRLVKFYKENNYPSEFSFFRFSSHSQYFEVLLELGIFALLFLCAIFVIFPYYFDGKSRIFATFVITMYTIQGLTDAMLGGCTGVMLFCIAIVFCMLFSNEQLKLKGKE